MLFWYQKSLIKCYLTVCSPHDIFVEGAAEEYQTLFIMVVR